MIYSSFRESFMVVCVIIDVRMCELMKLRIFNDLMQRVLYIFSLRHAFNVDQNKIKTVAMIFDFPWSNI